MMPPYTSLWLQILLEIKGTAAWLRTGEASPVSEEEGVTCSEELKGHASGVGTRARGTLPPTTATSMAEPSTSLRGPTWEEGGATVTTGTCPGPTLGPAFDPHQAVLFSEQPRSHSREPEAWEGHTQLLEEFGGGLQENVLPQASVFQPPEPMTMSPYICRLEMGT